jgi:hypothetical protein
MPHVVNHRVVCRAAVVVVLASGVAAGVGTTVSSATPTASARALAQVTQWVRAAQAATQQASHGTAITTAPDANSPALSQQARLVPVGHLGGRQDPVVLDIRTTDEPPDGPVGITARAARTGHAFWHRTYSGKTNPEFLPEPLGDSGTLGVVVVQFSSTTVSTDDITETMTLTALSGVTGATVWTASIPGSYDPLTLASSGIAVGALPFHDAHRKTIDFLVPTHTTLGPDQELATEVVSGVNGSYVEEGGTYAASDTFPTAAVIPDINQDGLADVLIDSPNSFVQVEGGPDLMATLWTTDLAVPGSPEIIPIGHYSHKTSPDIAVAAIQNGQAHATINVLAGATGKLLWTRTADQVLLVHKAGPKRVPAVVLATQSSTHTTTSSTSKVTTTWHYAAVTPANRVLYSKQVTGSSVARSPATPFLFAQIATVGDVNHDGSADIHVTIDGTPLSPGLSAVAPSAKPQVHAEDGIIDGRNGDFHALAFTSGADGSLHNGAATDLLSTAAAGGHPRITAYRGSTRKRYYTRRLTGLSGWGSAWTIGLRVTGHHCSDIALAAQAGPDMLAAIAPGGIARAGTPLRGLVGILSARGAPLWTVKFPTKDAIGGTLTLHKKPAHFCI